MSDSTVLHIQDKNGAHFRTVCSTAYKAAEIRNLERHLNNARANPKAYGFLDLDTARIYENGEARLSDDEILKELEA